MPPPFCPVCLSDFFLWHRPGCEAWVFPIVWPAPDPGDEGAEPKEQLMDDQAQTTHVLCPTCQSRHPGEHRDGCTDEQITLLEPGADVPPPQLRLVASKPGGRPTRRRQ
jgi:hypothetical protein